jgi:arylsulfatase A-like enzyme
MRTRTARDGAFVVVKSRKEDRVRLSGLLRRLCGKALIAAAFTFSLLTPVSAAEQPPNFIVIFTDDLGYGDLPSYGNSTIRTPRLDQMAAEGVRLTEFYSAAPTCTPARAALLTGRYPKRSGLVRVLAPWERAGLPLSEITLAEALKQQGYATACIGKWHLGGLKRFRPDRQGFDQFFGVLFSNDMTLMPIIKFPRFELFDGSRVVESPARNEMLTQTYTHEAVRFIRNNRSKPFFLYLAHSMPHKPVAASRAFRGNSGHGVYGDAVEELDWSAGQIVDALREAGIDRRTVVVFTSDNGPWAYGAFKKKVKGGSAEPLRGWKGTTWEGGMRVPMIAWWPGRLPQGGVRGGISTTMDLFTTFIELAGGQVPSDRAIDGKNIMALLEGAGPSPHETLYYYHRRRVFAVRQGDWKLHVFKREAMPGEKLHDAVRCDPPELYNLAEDLSETRNRAAGEPEIVARLAAMAEQFDASIQPVMRLPARTRLLLRGF